MPAHLPRSPAAAKAEPASGARREPGASRGVSSRANTGCHGCNCRCAQRPQSARVHHAVKGGRRASSVTSPPRLHSIWNARPRPQLQAETRPLQSSENETLFCADASDAEPHLRRSRAKRGGIHTSSRPPPRRCTAVAWRVRWWRWIWRWWLRVSASSGPHVRAAREQRSADARAPRWRAAAPDSGEARRLYVYHIEGVGCGPGPARHTLLRAGVRTFSPYPPRPSFSDDIGYGARGRGGGGGYRGYRRGRGRRFNSGPPDGPIDEVRPAVSRAW